MPSNFFCPKYFFSSFSLEAFIVLVHHQYSIKYWCPIPVNDLFYPLLCWVRVYAVLLENSVDPDQLASLEASWSGSTLLSISAHESLGMQMDYLDITNEFLLKHQSTCEPIIIRVSVLQNLQVGIRTYQRLRSACASAQSDQSLWWVLYNGSQGLSLSSGRNY